MSEISISKEEATNWLEKSAPIFICTPDEFERFGLAVNKAISDMESVEVLEKENAELKRKLEKIAGSR